MAILTQEQKEALLSDRELREYQIYMRLNQPAMAKSVKEKFFTLFLNGQNCEEIQRLNPNGFSLGAVVRARIEDDWDEKKQEHQARIITEARERLQQITVETMNRVALELAASNKLATEKILLYMQTGEEEHLAGTNVGSLKHLKDMVEVLQKLTGQDQKKDVSGTVVHTHTLQPAPPEPDKVVLSALPVGEPVKPQLAASALEAIHKNRGGK